MAGRSLPIYYFRQRPGNRLLPRECEERYPTDQMTVSVFVGTSVDGFIARKDGSFDFLPADGGEPHGYEEFFASVDGLVIGRHTFETVLAFFPLIVLAAGQSI